MATDSQAATCYLLKRFPRLSETFILNEIRALERLGTRLAIISLLARPNDRQHAAVAEVRAPVEYLPDTWWRLIAAAAKAHGRVLRAAGLGYFKAAGWAFWIILRFGHPLATFKRFLRAILVADSCVSQNIRHIHAHFANTPTSVAHLVNIMCGIKFSFTTHAKDLYLTDKTAIEQRVEAAEFVLTCTRYNLDYLKSFVPRADWEKLRVVYHGIDLAAFATYFGRDSGARAAAQTDVPTILSVGRLVPKKGMRDLVAACGQLRDRGIVFRCDIVGEGPLKDELERQIAALDLSGTVSLLGAMTHDHLIDVYGQATLFVLAPQITESGDRDGIPNVLVEAMAAGLPVVSTTVSGIPELVEHGRTGILVQPGDPAALAAAIAGLLPDASARNAFAAAAQCQLKERFECWESTKAIHSLLTASSAP
jgi:glycosyltransferase involved in cell wall biosynthesis